MTRGLRRAAALFGLAVWALLLWPADLAAETVADGIRAYREGNYQGARDILRPLAEAGDPVAQFNLGKLYEYGGGEVRQDYTEAARWYQMAVDQGVTEAENNLALMYSLGLGVTRDHQRAAALWKRAAESGYRLAQYNLALAYFRGEGVARDERLAALWFEKAAYAGLPDAQYAMGQLRRLGRGGKRDPGQALGWYRLAADQNHADAVRQVEALEAEGVEAKAFVPLEGVAEADETGAEVTESAETAEAVEPSEETGETEVVAGVVGEVPLPLPKPLEEAAAEAEPETENGPIYRLWLFSADTAVAAEDLRTETLTRHGALLDEVKLDIFEVDHGERGHFYRILAGPLYSADAADELCRRLRAEAPEGFCKVLTP